VVVVDGPADLATSRVAREHGATLDALGEHRGINAARNRAAELAQGDLLAFLDDDVELWPHWHEALTGAAGQHPDVDCFGGPIHARLEGPAPRGCGRPQDAPVTVLDLGPVDRDAEFAWGANFAVRRSAIERVGPFAGDIVLYGDEEDWQRRLRSMGGRVRYVARAGVDHRRAGEDARLRALARAAYHRGRGERRYDARKRETPSLAQELRPLAGTIWHAATHGCAAGLVPVARISGRVAEALTSSSR
jgi:GT2 family glycosyltransferase